MLFLITFSEYFTPLLILSLLIGLVSSITFMFWIIDEYVDDDYLEFILKLSLQGLIIFSCIFFIWPFLLSIIIIFLPFLLVSMLIKKFYVKN